MPALGEGASGRRPAGEPMRRGGAGGQGRGGQRANENAYRPGSAAAEGRRLNSEVRQHRNLVERKDVRRNHVGLGLADDFARQAERLRSCLHGMSNGPGRLRSQIDLLD